MYLKMYKKYGAALSCLLWVTSSINAQTDSLFLTVDQLFERGVQYSLQLQADAMKESMAQERMRTARSAQLPELQIGLKGGFVGQPVVWERGLSDPVYPEAPDWSQNYAIDLAQPLYQGGKIRSAIHKADIEKKGYVYRKEDPADRRNKLVFLTPEGEEFKDQIRPILDQVYVYAEKIIGIESIETMLSELKGVYDVLENV